MKFFKRLILLVFLFYSINSFLTEKSSTGLLQNIPVGEGEQHSYKMLFMYKYPAVSLDTNNPLNTLNFKNIILRNNEVSFFESIDPVSPTKDKFLEQGKYLFTMRYDYIDLPCVGGFFICKHAELVKDVRPKNPTLDYTIPKEVIQRFGDENRASEQCVVLSFGPFITMNDLVWICHEDAKTVYDFQTNISSIIRKLPAVDFLVAVDYLEGGSKRLPGYISVEPTEIIFKDVKLAEKFKIPYKSVGYSYGMNFKEEIQWEGDANLKPERERCIKLNEESLEKKNGYVFCIYYERDDVERKNVLMANQASILADSTSNKINLKLQQVKVANILKEIKEKKNLNEKELKPLIFEISDCKGVFRHQLIQQAKLKMIETQTLDSEIKQLPKRCISDACQSNKDCFDIANYLEKSGLIPQERGTARWALDKGNPYLPIIPAIPLDLPKTGNNTADKVIDVMDKIINGDIKTKALPESAPGEVPNKTAIVKSLNTIAALRLPKKFDDVSEALQSCKLNLKNNSNDLRKKVALLPLIGDNDPLFSYLGYIKQVQAGATGK